MRLIYDFNFRWSLIAGRIPGRTANDVKNYWNTHLRSRPKQQKGQLKVHKDGEQSKHTMVTIIKPQPCTISKALNLSPYIASQDTHNLLTSSSMEAFNISPGVVSSPTLSADKVNEYLDELFDDPEKEIDDQVGWSLEGNSLFDFPLDDVVMLGLLD